MDDHRVRQVAVTAAAVFMIFGTLLGIGVIGTRVEESSGGSLSATATLLAPAGPAFSIWTVIYIGLVAYTVYQWLPARASSTRLRSIGWLAGASMVLNAAWLLVTQAGWLWVSVAVIVALVVTLGLLVRTLEREAAPNVVERVIVDGTFGLYLGWVAIATAANITATLVDMGITFGPVGDQALAAVVLAVAACIGVGLSLALGARLTVAGALAWGLAWIAIGRLAVGPISVVTGVAAALAAVVVIGAAVALRLRSGTGAQRSSRAARTASAGRSAT